MRKITSNIMFISFIVMSFTGVILYLAPHRQMAKKSGWEFLWLTKPDYAHLHITFMVLFLIFGIFHIYFNWKCLTNYWKSLENKKFNFLNRELLIAILLSLIFFVGTIMNLSPFSDFIEFGREIGDIWASQFSGEKS